MILEEEIYFRGQVQIEDRWKMKPRGQWPWAWRFISLSSFLLLLYWEKSGILPSLDDLEFLALLLPPPGCWDSWHAPPHPVLRSKFLTRVCVLLQTCLHSFPRQLYSDCLWRLFKLTSGTAGFRPSHFRTRVYLLISMHGPVLTDPRASNEEHLYWS